MYGDNIKRKVIAGLEENNAAVRALLDPPFKIQEVFDLITEAVELVETISPEHVDGKTKRAIVQSVLLWADKKFKITATALSALLDFVPRWLRWAVPGKRIVAKLFPLLVDLIVSVLNRYVWKQD